MNKTDVLSKVSLFSEMKKSDLEMIAKLAQNELFQAGDTIIREGDRDGRLFTDGFSLLLVERWQS
jgi:hypothetical protein